jgi:hypothetical protein
MYMMCKIRLQNAEYDYVCFCLQEYVGESKRPFKERLKEHQYKSKATAIYSHTSICPLYQGELLKKYGTIPSRNTTEFFSKR